MIRYALRCGEGHGFDAWFNNAAAYDDQADRGLIECPVCGDHDVAKAPMAPAIGRTGRHEPTAGTANNPAALRAALMALTRRIKAHAEDVGPTFADEARRIHLGQSPERPIWGRATAAEAADLRDDGIDVHALPDVPDHDA